MRIHTPVSHEVKRAMNRFVVAKYWLPLLLLGSAAATGARADTLYKCLSEDGNVAYTNRPATFTGCKALSSVAPQRVNKPAAGSAQATRAWEYRESADATATSSGVVSTAVTLTPPAAASSEPKAAPTAKPRVVRGAIYRVERSNGITEYTNVRPPAGKYALLFSYISTCVACDPKSTIDFSHTALNLDVFKDEIARASADYGVDAALLRAVMHAESAFNPMALSSKGAQGLMQLMPGTAADLGVLDAFDISQNIRGGAQYLARMLKNFNGDERLAAAAYNAGPGAVQKYGAIPPYTETMIYVERVATLRERYRKAM